MVPGQAFDPPEHGLVGPPGAPEHVERSTGRRRQRSPAGRRGGRRRGRRRSRARTRSRRCFQSRTCPGMSASDSDAAITTAASVGCGRSRNKPGTNTSITAIRIAPTRPVTCVFAPACSATAVRDPLVLTGKPWKRPAPRLQRRSRPSPGCRPPPHQICRRMPTTSRWCRRARRVRSRTRHPPAGAGRNGAHPELSVAETPREACPPA